MANVDIYLDSELGAADVREFGADAVVLATGSRWRRDGQGATVRWPVEIAADVNLLTPDDLFAGRDPGGDVLIYDDEHYFMAGALAERLARAGHRVRYLTPATKVSAWTEMTDEQEFIQRRLLELGIEACFGRQLKRVEREGFVGECVYTGAETCDEFSALLLVTGREPVDSLFSELDRAAIRIGDCLVPSSIADAVYAGHRCAREFGEDPNALAPRRERVFLQADIAGIRA